MNVRALSQMHIVCARPQYVNYSALIPRRANVSIAFLVSVAFLIAILGQNTAKQLLINFLFQSRDQFIVAVTLTHCEVLRFFVSK